MLFSPMHDNAAIRLLCVKWLTFLAKARCDALPAIRHRHALTAVVAIMAGVPSASMRRLVDHFEGWYNGSDTPAPQDRSNTLGEGNASCGMPVQ